MNHEIKPPSADEQVSDTIFELLSHQRRRYVVRFLSGRDSPIALTELATAVASRETETKADVDTADATDELAIELHHVHLPKLADADAIDYHAETKTVVPGQTEIHSALENASCE